MPSRPVLIGRGLVPHPHTNKNTCVQRSNTEHVSRPLPNTKQPTYTHNWIHATTLPTNPVHTPQPVGPELRRPQRQGNTRTHPEPGS
jgi:hypothetical protein